MNEEAKAARRAYRRKWARENPDKIRAQQARYWEKQARMRKDPGKIETEVNE